MDTSLEQHGLPSARTVARAEAITLLAFVAYVALPGAAIGLGLGLMVAGSLAASVCAALWSRGSDGSVGLALVVVASAVGLPGSVAYLHSLADEPSAIPLGGVGALLLSLVGLFVSAVRLHGRGKG